MPIGNKSIIGSADPTSYRNGEYASSVTRHPRNPAGIFGQKSKQNKATGIIADKHIENHTNCSL